MELLEDLDGTQPDQASDQSVSSGTSRATGRRTKKVVASKAGQERIAFRLPADVAENLRYWAKYHNISLNEYVVEAIVRSVAWENQDYPLPTLEQKRLAQLIDAQGALSANVANLEQVVISNFEALLNLTRGDANYLLDSEDGEL